MASARVAARLHGEEVEEEEDASQLKLGADFGFANCLTISEVRILLEARGSTAPDTPVYNKTLAYVKLFTKFPTQESTSAVRELIQRDTKLSQFEIAQIGNLCPAAPEEAKSVIPSLSKVDDDILQPMLDELQTLRKFQT